METVSSPVPVTPESVPAKPRHTERWKMLRAVFQASLMERWMKAGQAPTIEGMDPFVAWSIPSRAGGPDDSHAEAFAFVYDTFGENLRDYPWSGEILDEWMRLIETCRERIGNGLPPVAEADGMALAS